MNYICITKLESNISNFYSRTTKSVTWKYTNRFEKSSSIEFPMNWNFPRTCLNKTKGRAWLKSLVPSTSANYSHVTIPKIPRSYTRILEIVSPVPLCTMYSVRYRACRIDTWPPSKSNLGDTNFQPDSEVNIYDDLLNQLSFKDIYKMRRNSVCNGCDW